MGNELNSDELNICRQCGKCKEFPKNYWSEIPDTDCELFAIAFMRREDAMQKVRRAKEELLDLKVLKNKTGDFEKLKGYEIYEKRLMSIIKKFEPYGAQNW